MAETQTTKLQIRRDTTANWVANDPTPSEGEWCLETDTKKIKIGDGSTAYTSLDYYLDGRKEIDTRDSFHNYLHGSSITEQTVYNTISPYIPDVNDTIVLSGGGFGLANEGTVSRAQRTSSDTITIYLVSAGASPSSYTYKSDGSGSASTWNYSISW